MPEAAGTPEEGGALPARRAVRVGTYRMPVPRTRLGRTVLGGGLCFVGTVGFAMPVIGLWMWGPGLLILSVDYHGVRRFRRRNEVRLIRWWRTRKARRRERSR